MADEMVFEVGLERNRAAPVEPTIPGPVTSDQARIYAGDYAFGGGALNPATLNDTNTIWVNSITGNDANPGTFASPKLTLEGPTGALNTVDAFPGFLFVGMTGTFRERVDLGRHSTMANLIAAPGQTATIEAPDAYAAGAVPVEPPQVAAAFLPSIGHDAHVGASGGLRFDVYYGAATANSVIARMRSGAQPAVAYGYQTEPTFQLRGGGAPVATAFVKRAIYNPYYSAVGFSTLLVGNVIAGFRRPTRLQYFADAEQPPDWDTIGAPVYARLGGAYSEQAIDAIRNPLASVYKMVALTYIQDPPNNYRLILYGARRSPNTAFTGIFTWEPLFQIETLDGDLGLFDNTFIEPGLTIPVSFSDLYIRWNYLQACNGRIYCLNPVSPGLSQSVRIIKPFCWDEFGNQLGFEAPIKIGPYPGQSIPFQTTQLFSIVFFRGSYYLATTEGIYRSADGLTGWALVFESQNVTTRFLLSMNGVLFCSSARRAGSQLTAATTLFLWSFNGVDWNSMSVADNYSGYPCNLGNGKIMIPTSVSSVSPFIQIQEPVIWAQGMTAGSQRVENIYVDGRQRCGKPVAEWYQSAAVDNI